MAQATNDKPNTDAAGDATHKTVEDRDGKTTEPSTTPPAKVNDPDTTVQSNIPDTERNEEHSDKERAKIAKETALESIREVHGEDIKDIRDLPLAREGVLAGALDKAAKAQMDDAIYNVIRVLDAAGDAADKNADLRNVKEALAKGLGADIEFLV